MELTQSQLMIWMGQQFSPNSPLYNMALCFEFRFPIQVDSFKTAFNALVAHCDNMRTVFNLVGEKPTQKIIRDFSFEIELIDFSNSTNQNESLDQWISNESAKLFDLSQCNFDSAIIKMADNHFIWYLNQHHLITDAWGVTVQYKQFAELYKKCLSENPILEYQSPKFSDYILYEHDSKNTPRALEANKYWSNTINKFSKAPNFFGKSNKELESKSFRINRILPAEKSNKLRLLTKEKDLRSWSQDLSLFNIFSTVLFSLLYRITGQSNLAIGCPSHNRSSKAFKKTPGMFIKVFPIGLDIEQSETFISLYKKVQEENNAFIRYANDGEVSSEVINRFNVVFNYITASFGSFLDQKISCNWFHSGHSDPGHVIRLQIYDFKENGEITISTDYNQNVFTAQEANFISDNFINLIDLFIENRNLSVLKLPSMEAELIASFNDTTQVYPELTIVDLFYKQVALRPNDPSVEYDEIVWSFQTLNEKSNQIAHYLLDLGIEKEDLIVVCLERSHEMISFLLGIIKSGAAYVPLDPDLPSERIQYVLEDTRTKHLITHTDYTSHLPEESKTKYIFLDKVATLLNEMPIDNPEMTISLDQLMFVIYTSGSTGLPKGVMNEHGGVANRLLWAQQTYQLNPVSDVVLQKTTFAFDVSVWELFWPLISGVKLVFAKPGGHKDPAYLQRIINDKKITTIHFVPPMLDVFLLQLRPELGNSLKRVLCSGEELMRSTVNTFKEKIPHVELHNLYGPTEAAIDVTAIQLLPGESALANVFIGAPVANTGIHILDENKNVCPIGTEGELYISGRQLARGYHNRAQLTQEKFLILHTLNEAPKRMYRTGDLAQWHPSGNIIFRGRKDQQVKIRGFRIELGEIEYHLSRHQSVNQCHISTHVDGKGNKLLMAYIVSSGDENEMSLINHLSAKLPEYMIPSRFVFIPFLPVNVNGKIDRKLLPKPNNFQTKIERTPPSNEFETIIHDIWEEVLQLQNLDIHTKFRALGGDSLSAIRCVIRINEAMDLDLPINTLFVTPTIFKLAQYIERVITKLLSELDHSKP